MVSFFYLSKKLSISIYKLIYLSNFKWLLNLFNLTQISFYQLFHIFFTFLLFRLLPKLLKCIRLFMLFIFRRHHYQCLKRRAFFTLFFKLFLNIASCIKYFIYLGFIKLIFSMYILL